VTRTCARLTHARGTNREDELPGGELRGVRCALRGYDLFVPDHGPFRTATHEEQIWKYQRIMSLDTLLDLGAGRGLAGAL
jgi:hypothetical protein